MVDTFKFSTTVVTALKNNDISRVRTASTYEELSESEIPSGGDHTEESEVGNNPLVFHETGFENDTVGLTSDNGATAVHHILENGGNHVVLGCLRNLSAVSEYAREQESDVVIFPANRHGNPVLEDYYGSVLIYESIRGQEYTTSDISDMEERMLESIRRTHSVSDVLEFCLRIDRDETIPYTDDGVFTR